MPMLAFEEIAVADQETGPELPEAVTTLVISEPDGELYGFNKVTGEERRAVIVSTAYPFADDSEVETGKGRIVIGKSRSVTLPLQSEGRPVQHTSTLFVPLPKEKTETVSTNETESEEE